LPRDGAREPFLFAVLLNAGPFWVLVHSGLGDHKGFGTAEVVVVCNSDDTLFVPGQHGHGGVAWFTPTGFAGALRSMMDLSNGDLKGVIQFKLFVAV